MRNKTKCNITVFTDISKAFDSVQLHEMTDVIWQSEIPPAYKWLLSSFVENRQFRVELRDHNGNTFASRWRNMLYGTPQGSVFGPLLWNMFFDPLLYKLEITADSDSGQSVESLNLAFCDDLALVATSKEPQKAEKHLDEKLEIFRNFLETS